MKRTLSKNFRSCLRVKTEQAGGATARAVPANSAAKVLAHIVPGAYRDVLHRDGANVRPDFLNGVSADDGIAYSIRTFDQDSSLVTKKGWDDVTGIGTPTGLYPQAFANS